MKKMKRMLIVMVALLAMLAFASGVIAQTPAIKFSPLDFSLRRLLYEDSSFYFILSSYQEQLHPQPLLPPAS